MRQVKQLNRLQPLQVDTALLKPNCFIPGIIGAPADVVGATMAAKVTLSRNANISMPDGVYRVECVVAGAAGTGTFKITDLDRSVVSAATATAAGAIAGMIAGVDIIVANTTGCTAGHYCEFVVVGDQTYIIPGTIIGRVSADKLWVPATDALISSMDAFGIVTGFQETDKTKTVLPHGYENSVSQAYAIEYIVYGQVRTSVCTGINLTANLKAKLPQIAWI